MHPAGIGHSYDPTEEFMLKFENMNERTVITLREIMEELDKECEGKAATNFNRSNWDGSEKSVMFEILCDDIRKIALIKNESTASIIHRIYVQLLNEKSLEEGKNIMNKIKQEVIDILGDII